VEHAEHDAIDRFVLEHNALEGYVGPGTTRDRANSIARFLFQYAELEEEGRNLTDVIVEEFVAEAMQNCTRYGQFDYGKFSERYAKLNHALQRDGFTVEEGKLRRTLPEALNLPQADDEVHVLLKRYEFDVPLGISTRLLRLTDVETGPLRTLNYEHLSRDFSTQSLKHLLRTWVRRLLKLDMVVSDGCIN